MVVVGGGIVGAGAARDAALRGLSCLLLERGDWASGTTGRAAGVMHGGLRFARQRKLHLALECTRERDILLQMAPHLIQPLPVVLPFWDKGRVGLWRVRMGFRLFDLLSMGRGTPHHDLLGPRDALRRVPALRADGLSGAGLFYDSQVLLPHRLVMEHVLSAREYGAACLNYHELTAVRKTDRGFELEVRNHLSGETVGFETRSLLNAAGAWADEVGERVRPGWRPRVRNLKGCQVWIDTDLEAAVWAEVDPAEPPLLVLPRDGPAVAGWVQSPWDGDPAGVRPEPSDVERLAGRIREVLPGALARRGALLRAEAGVWAVPRSREPGTLASLPCVRGVEEDLATPGFFTLLGGNLTLFRRLAEEGVDAACRHLGHKVPSSTDRVPLFGGGFRDRVIFRENLVECTERIPNLPRPVVDHLVGLYGRKCCEVIELGIEREEWRDKVAPGCPDYRVQVIYAVRREDARHLDDVLLRRLRVSLGPDRGLGAAEPVARLMAGELGWDEATVRAEVERFREIVEREMAPVREVEA